MSKKCFAGALLGTFGLLGCFDGSIEVHFDLPDGAAEVSTYTVIVYAEAADEISCDDLAFDNIAPDALDTLNVFEASIGVEESTQLTNIPRKGKKLFFAEALDASGISLYAGCQEVGEITGPTVVNIEGFERTNASFQSPELFNQNGEVVEFRNIDVAVVRLDGTPLVNEPVQWTLRGASKQGVRVTSKEVATEADGIATIVFVAADIPPSFGPARLDIRSRWSQSQVEPLTGTFDPTPRRGSGAMAPDIGVLRRANDLLEVGRRSENGPLDIFVLATESDGRATVKRFELDSLPDPAQVVNVGDSTGQGAMTLGKIRRDDGDKIIAVWEDNTGAGQWTDMSRPNPEVNTTPSPYSGLPFKLGAVGGCDGGPEEGLFAQVGAPPATPDIELATFNGTQLPRGADVPFQNQDFELVEIGCVRNTLGDFQTVFVADMDPTQSLAFNPFIGVLGGNQPLVGSIPTQATAAYIGDFVAGAEGTLVLGEGTPEGPATARYLTQAINLAQPVLVADFLGSDPTPNVVLATAEGDINGDGLTDIVSLVSAGLGERPGETPVRLHISMAIPGTKERLRGSSVVRLPTLGPRLRVANIDGDLDGTDDIIIHSADLLLVYLMGDRTRN